MRINLEGGGTEMSGWNSDVSGPTSMGDIYHSFSQTRLWMEIADK